MSDRNVEIVKAMQDAFNRGDYASSLQAFDPDVEGDFTHMPEGRSVRGREELRREVARWQLTWDELQTNLEGIYAAGENVVTFVHQAGIGKLSGAEMDMRYAQVFKIQDGKIISMKTYLDRDEALQAAGITGPSGHVH